MTWDERKLRFINENVWIGQAVQERYDSGKAWTDFMLWDYDLAHPGFRYECEHGKRECEECDR